MFGHTSYRPPQYLAAFVCLATCTHPSQPRPPAGTHCPWPAQLKPSNQTHSYYESLHNLKSLGTVRLNARILKWGSVLAGINRQQFHPAAELPNARS